MNTENLALIIDHFFNYYPPKANSLHMKKVVA